MQTHWMRYAWIVVALAVLALVAILLSANVLQRSASPTLAQVQQSFDNNDFTGALAAADGALAQNPGDVSALLAKATILAQMGNIEFKEKEYGEQAIGFAQQVLALEPNNAEAWRIIGYANEIMQNYPVAHEAYEKAMTLDPDNALAVAADARAWDLQGDMGRADEGYRKALALQPPLAQANLGLARVLVYQGHPKEALLLFEYVADNPGNMRQRAEAAYSAGQIYEMSGDHASAEVRFRSATTLDPQYALGWTGLSISLFQQVREKYPALSDDHIDALMRESMESVEKALAINPNQSLANSQFAIQMLALGRTKDALIILKGMQKKIIDADIALSSVAKEAIHRKVQDIIGEILKDRTNQDI